MERLGLIHAARIVFYLKELIVFARYLDGETIPKLKIMLDGAYKRYSEIRVNELIKEVKNNEKEN